MNTFTNITIDELKERIAGGSLDRLWNVLTDDYFDGRLLPGSTRAPLDRIGRIAGELPRDTSIAVYCGSYTCPQSRMAAEKLVALGFTNVLVYEGGLTEWIEQGNSIVTEPVAVA